MKTIQFPDRLYPSRPPITAGSFEVHDDITVNGLLFESSHPDRDTRIRHIREANQSRMISILNQRSAEPYPKTAAQLVDEFEKEYES